jgi:DNA-directed RNA polymerase specialized sigma24 family protein
MGQGRLGQLIERVRQLEAGGEEAADQRLVDRIVSQQDEAAFAAVLKRHGPMVFGVCRRVLGNLADCEDAFQATSVS